MEFLFKFAKSPPNSFGLLGDAVHLRSQVPRVLGMDLGFDPLPLVVSMESRAEFLSPSGINSGFISLSGKDLRRFP